MKKSNNKQIIVLSILILGFLISASSWNTYNSKAIVNEIINQNEIELYNPLAWNWNLTEVISTDSISQSGTPSIGADLEGNIHIVWGDAYNYSDSGSDWDICYKRWNSSTSSWTAIEVISPESTEQSIFTSLDVDIAGNVHVVWRDATDYASAGTDQDIFYKRWDASTSTWGALEVVSTESTQNSGSPSIDADNKGNIHVVWSDSTDYASAGTDIDIFYKRWDIITSSWTTTEVVSTESTSLSDDSSVTTDAFGNIHVVWIDFTNYDGSGTDTDIFYKRWDASISSWTTTEVVSTESTDFSFSPSITVDSSYFIHIAWQDETDYANAGTDRDIFYKQWNSATSSWTTTGVISTESTGDSYVPKIAIDSQNNLHIVWYDYTNIVDSGSDEDIFYRRLNAKSQTWSPLEVVSTESTSGSMGSSMIVDSADQILTVWVDSTDYEEAETDQDIFFKRTLDFPDAPELAFIVPNPTETSIVSIDWNNISRANSYFIYRSDYYIWSVEELTPIDEVSNSYYADTLPTEGFFYYVIVASNYVGNSSHSNCQYVEYRLPHVREFTIISSLIIGAMVISLVVMKTRRNKIS